MSTWEILEGDCLERLRELPSASVDAVVTDPPYAEIDRAYGRLTEPEWHALMDGVVEEICRVLKPKGSAVFVLQANQERVGKTRLWLHEFVVRWGRRWNLVQDAYWWNHSAPPTVHASRVNGLMRPSVKWCVWLGDPDCYRSQGEVLWSESVSNAAISAEDRVLRRFPSGLTVRRGRCAQAAKDRGGVTPFNLLPIANANSSSSAGASGHGAGTPIELCRWWVRYLCPEGGTVLDPFVGSGTVALAAMEERRNAIGIEREPQYVEIARRRCAHAAETRQPELFDGVVA